MAAAEAAVEKYLHQQIVKLGGTTRKWVSPGCSGVPDRIVFINGRVIFVEVKTENGRLTTRQRREIETLRKNGADVKVIYGREEVDLLTLGIA